MKELLTFVVAFFFTLNLLSSYQTFKDQFIQMIRFSVVAGSVFLSFFVSCNITVFEKYKVCQISSPCCLLQTLKCLTTVFLSWSNRDT